MQDFIGHLFVGDNFLDQYFGVDRSYNKVEYGIIENFESIAEDAKYVIVNWKQLGFYIQD